MKLRSRHLLGKRKGPTQQRTMITTIITIEDVASRKNLQNRLKSNLLIILVSKPRQRLNHWYRYEQRKAGGNGSGRGILGENGEVE